MVIRVRKFEAPSEDSERRQCEIQAKLTEDGGYERRKFKKRCGLKRFANSGGLLKKNRRP